MSSPLAFKPNYFEAEERWLAFWDHELIDRPCCLVTALKENAGELPPPPPYMSGAREDFGPIVDALLARAGATWYGGEAMPAYTPSFGPDMYAAWLGADLEFDKDNYGTNWVVPIIEDWATDLPLRLAEDSPWWQRMLAFCKALGDAFAGKMLVAHLDLHSNMDALSALRLPERLCMDMMDVPGLIEQAVNQVTELYPVIYDALYEAAGMGRCGTTGWVPAFHPEKTNTIQCDFAALIGPDHFRRFVMPSLEREAAYLGHTVYHLDGPECLVHVDDLCSIPGLDCIQWVCGARNKPFIEWMDLLKTIQSKGVAVWVPCNAENIKVFHRELDPALLFYVCSVRSQAEGEEVLRWLTRNT
jgi:5-methyltetrahydrofolate--homocysteine methyltransferase